MPLLLPQAYINFEHADARHLVVLGGRAPLSSWLRSVASGKTVWAVDRGADACLAAGLAPHHVLGDFDSISEKSKIWLQNNGSGIKIERFDPDKDYTDFQLCLNCIKRDTGGILVTGCWGGRFDHAFANIFSALWGLEWGAKILAFADESEILIPLANDEKNEENNKSAPLELFFTSKAYAISLLPLRESCEGVYVKGTKWELNGATLTQGRPYAVSNIPSGEKSGKISVKIEKGIIGVYCFFGNSYENSYDGANNDG